MNNRQSSGTPVPTLASDRQRLPDSAFELLSSLETKLDVLRSGSGDTRRIAHEMQIMVEEMRRRLHKAVEG